MRRSRYTFMIAVYLILAAALISAVSGCGRNNADGKTVPGKAVYYCPMHPTYTSDKPGDCPICNMKLVKKEMNPVSTGEKTAEEVCIEHKCAMNNCPMTVRTGMKPGEKIACPICGEVISTASGKVMEAFKRSTGDDSPKAAGPTVVISAQKQQLIGVKTEPVVRKTLTKVIRASGKIAYDPELVITQEEFIQALKNEDNIKDSPLQDVADRARSMKEAARSKLKLLGMSDDQIAQLEKTKKPETNLYLPGKGENVWGYISIYEYEISLVKIGASVEVEAVAYPGEIFYGKVVSASPVLDPVTRTNQIRVEIVNTEDRLKPEMFVNARIGADIGERLAVPESAVLDTGLRKIVYLSKAGDVLESREIKTGQKAEGYYEVIEGLSEGDVVVTSGNFLIDSESRLKSAATGAAGHKGHSQ